MACGAGTAGVARCSARATPPGERSKASAKVRTPMNGVGLAGCWGGTCSETTAAAERYLAWSLREVSSCRWSTFKV